MTTQSTHITSPQPSTLNTTSEFMKKPYKRAKAVGKTIKCKFCDRNGVIVEKEGRYMVQCYTCTATYYLKNQHISYPHHTP